MCGSLCESVSRHSCLNVRCGPHSGHLVEHTQQMLTLPHSRLIMSAHRDLEAFKRLSYRKARLAGKGPAPYTSKGAGNLPPEERSWRDL